MEKTTYPTLKQDNKTVCDKLKRVIQTTSPFRAVRFSSNNQVHEEMPSNNVSLMTRTPVRDRCTRTDRCPRVSVENKREYNNVSPPNHHNVTHPDQVVPIIFRQTEDHSNRSSKPVIQTNKPKANGSPSTPQRKVAVLPIHGLEHRVPSMSLIGEKSSMAESIDGMFTEYIDRAGRKIRSPTIVDSPNVKHDSFNDKVSEFINRAKHKFHAPSLVDPSFKEKRPK